jgi:hypothetical protein
MVRRRLRGHRPDHGEGATQLAPGRLRSGRRRAARRPARQRTGRRERRSPLAELRCLPHQPVAAGQATRARRQHLRRVPPQRRRAHRPRPRPHRSAAPARRPPGGVLRRAPPPARRARRPSPQDRVRDPPGDPRRARRCRPPRARLPQRRPGRPRPTPAVHPQGRAAFLDRRAAEGLPASRRRSPALPGPVGRGLHRPAPGRAPRAQVG